MKKHFLVQTYQMRGFAVFLCFCVYYFKLDIFGCWLFGFTLDICRTINVCSDSELE